MWANNYVGIPFKIGGRARDGLDCWGLVCLIYKEQLGTILPNFNGVFKDNSVSNLIKISKEIEREKENWKKIEENPSPFDVILFRNKGLITHLGVIINFREMIHITDGINSCIESFSSLLWKNKVEGFYRWET